MQTEKIRERFDTVTIRLCDDNNGVHPTNDLRSMLKRVLSRMQTRTLVAVATASEIHVYDSYTKQLFQNIPFADQGKLSSVLFFSQDELIFATKDTIFVWNLDRKSIVAQSKKHSHSTVCENNAR